MHIVGKRRLWATHRYPNAIQRVRLFRVRHKVDATRSVNNGTSTSTVTVSEPIDITSEDDTNAFVKDVSELMYINISRIDPIQDS